MIRWTVTLLLACAGASAVAAALPDAQSLKQLADQLSPDGTAHRFPVERIALIQHRGSFAGLALLLAALLYGLPRTSPHREIVAHARALLTWLGEAPERARRFAREEPLHAWLLVALTLLGAGLALPALGQPMRGDEAGTFLKYVNHPWFLTLSVYNTNNHVLHNLLSNLSVSLLGDAEWAIRLPAFAAGVLVVPLAYAAMRVQLDRPTAILTAAVLATSTFLIDYRTSARGYTIVTVFFLALLVLAPRLLAPRPRAPRAAFVILATLGFFTIPVMAYPSAVLAFWLLAGLVRDVPAGSRTPQLLRLSATALAIAVGVLALYAPVMIVTEPTVIVSNEVIESARGDSRFELLLRSARLARGLWRNWSFGHPALLKWGMLLGFAASPLLFRRLGRHGGRLLLATAIGVVSVLLGTGANPPPWIFLFALPLYVGLSLAAPLVLARRLTRGAWSLERPAVGAALAIAVVGTWIQLRHAPWDDVLWYVGYRDAPAAAAYLSQVLGPEDRVDAHSVVGPPIFYYLYRSGFSEDPYELLRRNQRVGAVYFVDSGDRTQGRLAALERQGFDRQELAIGLERSRILRLTRSRP